jgi:diguanylate cyclase (GGDEF)-like protein
MNGSYTKLLSAIGARGSNGAGAPGMSKSWLARLSKGRSDDAVLGEVTQLFQACKSVQEICKVARNRLQAISPDLSGALYLTSTAGEHLEAVMTWGAFEAVEDIFTPDDCWALRRGRPHLVDRANDLISCGHTHEDNAVWHLCLPLMAQGEALGVLYFTVSTNGDKTRINKSLTTDSKLLFYMNFSETLAMALANMRLRESLQHQAIRDPLTGLFNRRYLHETLRRELKRVARAEEPLTAVTIDIDHFKKFNDTHGHDAGDEVLKTVAEILQSRTRAEDIACRLGGEEFALVYPGMPAEVAIGRVESILKEVQAHEIFHLGKKLDPVTLSAGIAVFPSHAEDPDALLHAADQALYQSKKAGRNRSTLADMPAMEASEIPSPIKLVHSAAQPATLKRAAGA